MQHRMRRFAPAAAAAALILTACGGSEVETADANLAVPTETAGLDGPDAVIIYPSGTEASLEPNALRTEVDRLQREQGSTNMQGGSSSAGQATGDQMAGQANDQMSGNQMSGQAGNQMAGESGDGAGSAATSFAGFDRDNDGRLSPAEYAIYALPSETPARQGAVNDENPPFVSDEALNQSITSFRRLDANGDFFLSPQEFQPGAR